MKLSVCLMALAALAMTTGARRLSENPAPAPNSGWFMPADIEELTREKCLTICSLSYTILLVHGSRANEELEKEYAKCISECPSAPWKVTAECTDGAKQTRYVINNWFSRYDSLCRQGEWRTDEDCWGDNMQVFKDSKLDVVPKGVQDVCGLDTLLETAYRPDPGLTSMVCEMVHLFDVSYHDYAFNLLSMSKFKDIGLTWCDSYVDIDRVQGDAGTKTEGG